MDGKLTAIPLIRDMVVEAVNHEKAKQESVRASNAVQGALLRVSGDMPADVMDRLLASAFVVGRLTVKFTKSNNARSGFSATVEESKLIEVISENDSLQCKGGDDE